MEPGINGASKWKAQSLLKEEGVSMEENGKGMGKHTATPEARNKRGAGYSISIQ